MPAETARKLSLLTQEEKEQKKKEKDEKKKKSKRKNKNGYRKVAMGSQSKRSKKNKQPTFTLYIWKVLKQIHPEIGIGKRGMNIMNSFMNDIFERMATEAARLLRTMNKKTLTSREIETSVRLMLPGELAKHAVSEGVKAVTNYTSHGSEKTTF